MPAFFIMSSVAAMSFFRKAAKLAGSPLDGVAPCRASVSTTSGAVSALLVSALILAITAAGVPGLESRVWYGIFVPAGTPAAVIAKINADTSKALAAPDVVETLATQGATPASGDPASFTSFLKKDIATTEDLMRKAGLPLTQ